MECECYIKLVGLHPVYVLKKELKKHSQPGFLMVYLARIQITGMELEGKWVSLWREPRQDANQTLDNASQRGGFKHKNDW